MVRTLVGAGSALEVETPARVEEIEALERHRKGILVLIDHVELGVTEVLIDEVDVHGGRVEPLIERKKPHGDVCADDLISLCWVQYTGKGGTADRTIGPNRAKRGGGRRTIKDGRGAINSAAALGETVTHVLEAAPERGLTEPIKREPGHVPLDATLHAPGGH